MNIKQAFFRTAVGAVVLKVVLAASAALAACTAQGCDTPPPPPPPPQVVDTTTPPPGGNGGNGGAGGNAVTAVSISNALEANAAGGAATLSNNIGGDTFRSIAFAAPGGANLGGISGVNGSSSLTIESDCMRAATLADQDGFVLPVVGGGLSDSDTNVDQALYTQCVSGASDRDNRKEAMTVAGQLCEMGNTDGTRIIFDNVAQANPYLGGGVSQTVQCTPEQQTAAVVVTPAPMMAAPTYVGETAAYAAPARRGDDFVQTVGAAAPGGPQ